MNRLLELFALGLVLGGCTLGPDHERPRTAADEATAYVHAPEAVESAVELDPGSVEPWWLRFGDEATAELVREALVANTDLRAAAARVLEAGAGLRQARAALFPEVSASAGVSRAQNSFVLPGVGRVTPIATTYSDSLSAAYQADLFGGLRRGREAAWAELLAEEQARQTVTHTVIAETVRARVLLATLGNALEVAEALRDSWAGSAETTERRYGFGLVSALDVRQARENLADAEAAVTARRRDLEQARLALDVLLGRRPGSGALPPRELADLPALVPVPLGLPADLLERRPDLRAAELQLAAATARVGVALADLFPGLTLTGSFGHSADAVGDLLSSQTQVFNVVASLVASVFDGGRRRAAVAAARARAEQAGARYAGTVLTALREVEDALVRERALREQLEHLARRRDEARAAETVARERYGRGVESFFRLLESERRLRQAEQQLVTVRGELWNARIDLHLALGGDWTSASADTESVDTESAEVGAAIPSEEDA